MRNLFTIAVAALGVATVSAQAQDPDALIPVNVSVRLGVGLPIDGDLRDISSSLFGIGLEYKIDRSLLSGGDTYFALDYLRTGSKGDKGQIIPFTLNQRFYLRQLSEGHRTYGFAGVGVAWLNGDEWSTRLAGRLGLGAELGDRIFFEGALTLTDKGDTFSGNTIGLYLGYRF